MKRHHHTPRKRFGQHFLTNQTIIAKIVAAIAPKTADHLVEIGPGQGVLTKAILPSVKQMIAIELDRDLIEPLKAACLSIGQIEIYQADALTFDFSTLAKDHNKIRLIGNLPYNISTPLLFHLIQYKDLIQDMHFMLQKEVVDRLTANIGGSEYNRLSVMVQYHCQTEALFTVPPTAFYPPPKVDSAVVRLTPYAKAPYMANDYEHFSNIVRLAFSHRRKTIKNNFKDVFSADELKGCAIDPSLRAQDLGVSDYVRLANELQSIR
jgi:16S rRNA (adenine1518-N6/adenine1519-N6)-dimethyltransferase